jgi:hypothetical protein
MKIISAQFTVRCDDDEIDAASEIDAWLTSIGFDGPINVTSIPSTEEINVQHVSFEPLQ